jgi:hypothetical protein
MTVEPNLGGSSSDPPQSEVASWRYSVSVVLIIAGCGPPALES